MRNILFFLVFILLLAISSQITVAEVLIEDLNFNLRTSQNGGFGDGTIETGTGEAGNYVIFNCAAPNDIGNVFNNPTPGAWSQIDQGACGGSERLCRLGIWSGFVDNPASEDITCSWTEFGTVFAATSIRFTGVDESEPIGNVACDSGVVAANEFIIAPEVFARAGSQVLSIVSFSVLTQNTITTTTNSDNPFITTSAEPEGFIGIVANSLSQNVSSLEASMIAPTAGTYHSLEVGALVPGEWRACTIEVRMPVLRNVPTMSEWGLIGFAAFAGIAGVWYLRRRQATA